MKNTALTKTSTEALTPVNSLTVALQSDRVCEATEISLDEIIYATVGQAFIYLNRSLEKPENAEQARVIINALPGELREYLPNFKVKEFPIAVKRMLYGEFGKYYGFVVPEIIRCCRLHYESEQRSEAVKMLELPEPDKKKPPTPLERFVLGRNLALEALSTYQRYKDTGRLAEVAYAFLNGLKLISFNQEAKNQYWRDAKEACIKKKSAELMTEGDKFKRQEIRNVISAFQDNFVEKLPLAEREKQLAIQEYTKILLQAYFDDLIEFEIDFAELLEGKKEQYIKNLENEISI